MNEEEILNEIKTLKFYLQMNELRSQSEYEDYKKNCTRLEELKNMLKGLKEKE